MSDLDRPHRPLSVKLLIHYLKRLPPDTLVYEGRFYGCEPMDLIEMAEDFGPFMVYEKDGETRLYIDQKETWHEYRDDARSLFFSGRKL